MSPACRSCSSSVDATVRAQSMHITTIASSLAHNWQRAIKARLLCSNCLSSEHICLAAISKRDSNWHVCLAVGSCRQAHPRCSRGGQRRAREEGTEYSGVAEWLRCQLADMQFATPGIVLLRRRDRMHVPEVSRLNHLRGESSEKSFARPCLNCCSLR